MSIGQGSILVQSKKETGTGNIPANNGLVFQDDNVQLGGGLIRETSIGLNTIGPFSIDGAIGSHLFFDITNGVYFFGYDTNGDQQLVTGWNFNETNQIEGRVAAKVGLRVVESINGLEFYAGDVNGDGNETFLYISDNDKKLEFVTNGNQNGLLIDNQNFIYNFGEFYGAQNGTFIRVNDTHQSIELTQVPSGAVTDEFATFDGDQIKKIPAPVESGTYTPVISNISNANTLTVERCQYMRVGNVVTVSGKFDFYTSAANTVTAISLTLPITSFLGDSNYLGGGCAVRDMATDIVYPVVVAANANDNATAIFTLYPATADAYSGNFSFTYIIESAP